MILPMGSRYLQVACGLAVAGGMASACSGRPPGRIVAPERGRAHAEWTVEERGKDLVVRNLRRTQEASFHLIRLRTAEPPHVHDRHDLTVFMLTGAGLIHLAGRVEQVGPGDVIEIPRGVEHWAENRDPQASEVYAVFTPPFDGKDRRLVRAKGEGDRGGP